MTGQYLAFGVLSMPVADLASKQAIKAAGCTHTVIVGKWTDLQSNGAGTALDATAVANLLTDFDQAASLGLEVLFEIAIHYPPSWAITGGAAVEPFKDQQNNVYTPGSQTSGKQVANWQWTALGRTYVADLIAKVATALGAARIAQAADVKMGGGYFGEAHYPASTIAGTPFSWWYNGASMQTGTGLSSDQVVCPNPGYTIFSGTDAQDSQIINWYLNGMTVWLGWFIAQMRAAGFAGNFHVCQPGYGVRSNQTHATPGYRQSAAAGEDPARVIGGYSHDPQVWPYSTWVNGTDSPQPPVVDSDLAAWKKVYLESARRNKQFYLWGENTGGEDPTGLAVVFAGLTGGSPVNGNAWSSLASPFGTYGYQGVFWLNYASLTSGSPSDAQLSDFAAAIAAHVATL